MSGILLVGHRGAKAYEPENTLRSFAAALKMGANAIEFDTRVTKDKKLVVIHDKTLDRTTDGKGNVADFTLAELRKFDAGGEKIPTAEEAVTFITKKGIALLEIKDKKSVDLVLNAVKGAEDRVLIISYYVDALKEVKQKNQHVQTGLIIDHPIKNIVGFFRLLKAIKADWILANFADKKFIEAAHKWKFKVEIWVGNTLTEIKKFMKLGADAIASDKPDLFKKV
jgi:glycerophosphoryl diester phosphodiesterase